MFQMKYIYACGMEIKEQDTHRKTVDIFGAPLKADQAKDG